MGSFPFVPRWSVGCLFGLATACGPTTDPPTNGPDAGSPVDAKGVAPDAATVQPFLRARFVFDGDTIMVTANGGARAPDQEGMDGQHVRLLGVDAPEVAHPERVPPTAAECWGSESAQALSAALLGEDIELRYDLKSDARCQSTIVQADAAWCGLRDAYGRLLAYVVRKRDGLVINEELIRNGNACAYQRFYHRERAHYAELEDTARHARRGIFSACPSPCGR